MAVPVGTLERLRELAAEADRSLSAEIRRAVNEHLARDHNECEPTVCNRDGGVGEGS